MQTTVATTTTIALANAHGYFAALAQNDIAAAEARGSVDRQALDDFDRHSASCADYAARLTREQQRAALTLLRDSSFARLRACEAIKDASLAPCEVRTFGEGWREDGSVDLRDEN